MSTRREADEWGIETPNIMLPEKLAAIREVLEQSPIIVEHWFYYGSRAPDRLIFDGYEDFEAHLSKHANPGDKIYIWRFDALCRDDNALTSGKYPDSDGLVPKKGCY